MSELPMLLAGFSLGWVACWAYFKANDLIKSRSQWYAGRVIAEKPVPIDWAFESKAAPVCEAIALLEGIGVKDDGGEKQEIVEEITRVVANAGVMTGAED